MNESIFYLINSIAGQGYLFDQLIIFFSDRFGYLLVLGLFISFFFYKDKKQGVRDILIVLSTAFFAYAIAYIFKHLLPHPRPFEVLSDAYVLYTHGGGDSFPSGHATFFMALATSLFFIRRRLALVYVMGALIIGSMRIAVGVHWPFDILAGWILGAALGIFGYYFLHYILTRITQKSSIS